MSPIIYLPIELQAREFESKALLAAILTERGYPVVFGQHWMMYANLDCLPAGVFLSKSFNRFHQPAMLSAKRAGHPVVSGNSGEAQTLFEREPIDQVLTLASPEPHALDHANQLTLFDF